MKNFYWLIRRKANGLQLFSFILCLVLLVWRTFPRLSRLELWAEDGTYFLPDALKFGWKSIFIPYAGYFDVLQRGLVWLGIQIVPLYWVPLFYGLIYLCIYAWVLSLWTKKDYEWLVPSSLARLIMGLLGCLCPGLNEMAGTMCNLNWILFFGVAMVGLRDPKIRVGYGQFAWVAISLFSIGTTLLLVPLFIFRFLSSQVYRWQNGVLLGLLFLSLAGLLVVKEKPAEELMKMPKVQWGNSLTKTTYENFILRPWLGDRIATELSMSPVGWRRRMVKIFAVILLVIGLFFRPFDRGWVAINLFAGSVLIWPLLGWVARPGILWIFGAVNPFFFKCRYAFPAGLVACFYWMIFLRPEFKFRKMVFTDLLGLIFVIINVVSLIPRFSIGPYGREPRWAYLVPLLESMRTTGSPAEVAGPIYPDGWNFQIGSSMRIKMKN